MPVYKIQFWKYNLRDVELISQNKRIFRREYMSKKVIFLDIDGTLAEPGHSEPPASAIEAVRKAQAAGNQTSGSCDR